MFKVLIVDDDNNVREGLSILVPWEEYGFSVTDYAFDGCDALEKYKKQAFDLIVVDIQMPKMDGLEFISALRRIDTSVHFLVLTGHAAFEYAREAIEYKVDGYILKPIDEYELIKNLKKIKVALEKENEEKLFAAGDNSWRCEMLIQSILSDTIPIEEPDQLIKKAEHLGLSWSNYQVLLIKAEANEEIDQGAAVNIRRRLKQLFNCHSKGVVFRWETFHGILINNAIKTEDGLQQLNNLLNLTLQRSGITFYSSIGEPVRSITEIRKSYEDAVKLLQNRFIAGSRRILSTIMSQGTNVSQNREEQKSDSDIQSMAEKLYYALYIGNTAAVNQLVSEWESKAVGNRYSENMMKTVLTQIISAALIRLSNTNRISQASLQDFVAELADIYNQPDLLSLKNFVLNQLEDIAAYMQDGDNEALALKMKNLVEKNFNEKLTLEVLADAFNYGSGYLGRLFKKYSGENFNTYLDRVRINKAKELLQRGVKVFQVANMVGYSNVDYFHSKFKKYVGVSPSHFRKEKDIP